MQDLNQYIVETLPENDAILDQLTLSIEQTKHFFSEIPFRETGDAWGYRVLDETAEKQVPKGASGASKLSQSTVSMIVASLLRDADLIKLQASSGFPWQEYPPVKSQKTNQVLETRAKQALIALGDAWSKDGCFNSRTYGRNDILSLSWHYDLFRSSMARTNLSIAPNIVKACEAALLERAERFSEVGSGYAAICEAFQDHASPVPPDARIGDSSYILLRFVRSIKSLADESATDDAYVRSALARAGKRFQSKLHDHLSLAEITDSRFDPAELAFCLEGLLLLKPEQVDHLLLDRAISVLTKAQEQSAYWRSETPIIIQQRGHVLFPIGVEAARSILNSLALFAISGSRQGRKHEIRPRHLTLLKRYWAWLKSRQTAIKRNAGLLYGWHSEHINDPDLIHTWETSQILEFLLGFRTLLAAHVADQLLSLSRLEVRLPRKPITWQDVVEQFEPYKRKPHNIYERIGTDFVDGRQSGTATPKNWSMLLFGPPGTGKSTVAENLGDCLQVPVITVTVSDFLGEGESRMESRVKNIFTVIERQIGAIVLFDEMDQFLLDRNSELFRSQDSVFQFLTPGMLTKFAKLRKSQSVIFIIATNYEERIDPAIKRTGRIDQRYLVLPPDNERRMEIIMGDTSVATLLKQLTEDEKVNLLEASCLLAYTDIKRVTASLPPSIDKFVEMLRQATRNIQFSAIHGRYSTSPTKGLDDELEGLIQLIDEAQPTRMTLVGEWEGSEDFVALMARLSPNSSPAMLLAKLDREKDDKNYRSARTSTKASRKQPPKR